LSIWRSAEVGLRVIQIGTVIVYLNILSYSFRLRRGGRKIRAKIRWETALLKRHTSEQADPASADQSSQGNSVPDGVDGTGKGFMLSTARYALYFAMSFAVMASALILAHI
jgi:hypothetical protein